MSVWSLPLTAFILFSFKIDLELWNLEFRLKFKTNSGAFFTVSVLLFEPEVQHRGGKTQRTSGIIVKVAI